MPASTREHSGLRVSDFRGCHASYSVTDWKAGAWAGVIAGLAFLMLKMVLVWMAQGQSPWGPPTSG